jgi:hypothetical protein
MLRDDFLNEGKWILSKVTGWDALLQHELMRISQSRAYLVSPRKFNDDMQFLTSS